MSERKIGYDSARLDDKVLQDDDDFLVMPAVIASEIVHKYSDGWAYKPASELEKAAWTADGRWVTILKHPDTALLQNAEDIYGKIEHPRFVKDLIDPKTKRPNRRGIRADVKWFKNKVPETVISQIKSGDLRDVSIGFTYKGDETPGEWNGQRYDYVQRNFFLDHVAAPIEAGRCPGPFCGIAVDSLLKTGLDPFSEYESFEDCVAKNQNKEDPEAYCASIKRKTEDESLEGEDEKIKDCPICQEIKKLGTLESSKRLAVAYGKDNVLNILKSVKPKVKPLPIPNLKPAKVDQTTEELLLESKKARESIRWLFQ